MGKFDLKISIAFILFLTLVLVASAQTVPPKFVAPDQSFSIQFPDTPAVLPGTGTAANGTPYTSTTYYTVYGAAYYSVSVTDYNFVVDVPADYQRAAKGVLGSGTLIVDQSAVVDGHPMYTMIFTQYNKDMQADINSAMVFVAVGKRMYIVTFLIKKSDDTSTTTETVVNFVNSFKIL
ncbi:Uncharacterised protein [uncultured archaeon]|nr:Uncharacterised protein [uncultured archaeon]